VRGSKLAIGREIAEKHFDTCGGSLTVSSCPTHASPRRDEANGKAGYFEKYWKQ